jgi:hypothetical protein
MDGLLLYLKRAIVWVYFSGAMTGFFASGTAGEPAKEEKAPPAG